MTMASSQVQVGCWSPTSTVITAIGTQIAVATMPNIHTNRAPPSGTRLANRFQLAWATAAATISAMAAGFMTGLSAGCAGAHQPGPSGLFYRQVYDRRPIGARWCRSDQTRQR